MDLLKFCPRFPNLPLLPRATGAILTSVAVAAMLADGRVHAQPHVQAGAPVSAQTGAQAHADPVTIPASGLMPQVMSGDKAALETLMAQARKGDANAQFSLGLVYFGGLGGIARDYEQAAQWFRKAANRGLPAAQPMLAFLYEKGQGVPQDYGQAARWYRKAAEQGVGLAQSRLGVLYEDGRGVPQDYVQAARWFRKAADQGQSMAQLNLGVLYARGQGVPQDYVQAAQWFRKAADQGDVLAQSFLGNLYENGQGVKQNYVLAAQWYRKAAAQGGALAQINLGILYENGRGVPRNKVAAYALYTLSATPGMADGNPASKNRASLVSSMTPQEVRVGQDLARKMNVRGNLLPALDQYLTAPAAHRG